MATWDGSTATWDGVGILWDEEGDGPRIIRPATIVKAQPATVAGEGTVE